MFDILEADIVVFQETKIQRKDLRDDMVLVPGWDCYFSLPRHKKGMSMSARAGSGARLTNGRVLWCRYLHAKFNLRSHSSRRRHHRRVDSSKFCDQFPRP